MPNQQRYCKTCNTPIQMRRQYCDTCKLQKYREYKNDYQRKKRKLITGFTKIEENQFLQQCIQNGIMQVGQIRKEYKSLGKRVRSQVWLIQRLKKLGIYQYPNTKTQNHFLFEDVWKEREKNIKEWGFTIIKNNTKASGVKIECNNCKTLFNYPTIRTQKGKCFKCEVQKRKEERERIKSENLDKINSAKNKEYRERVERLKEFIYNKKEEDIKEYKSWNKTPIHKEFAWYKSINNKEYRDKEIDYKIDWISYYIFQLAGMIKCPDIPKEGNKICNKCREEKPKTEFMGRGERNTCKPCAKEYRREFLLEDEMKKNRERYQNDPLYKLDSLLRAYIYGALKGRLKTQRTKEILGIEWYEFKEYIEKHFEDWMNWSNHGQGEGKWALQHIIPRDFATNEKEIYLINYYKNFIPMCSVQNGILKNRVVEEQLNGWHKENKVIQKILKRNKDKIIKENEFKTQYQITEIKPNEQTEQKLNKWFAF